MSRPNRWPMWFRVWYYQIWAERQNRKWHREHPELDMLP